MVNIRELVGTIGLAGLLYLPLNSQETPKNFKPVGIIESKEEDKNNNGVHDSEEKVIDYNNSIYKYFRVYHKETKKQTYFIADEDYKIINNPETYYNLFSVIKINEFAKRAKEQNFENSLSEWADDYKRINGWILATDLAKKAVGFLSELEGTLVNKYLFDGTKIPELIDYALIEGTNLIAEKRLDEEFNEVIMELATDLAKERPKDIVNKVKRGLRGIVAAKITEARRRLLIAGKRLKAYNPNKTWSLSEAKEFGYDITVGLEGLIWPRVYLASVGSDKPIEYAAELITKNFAEGFTGLSVEKIAVNLNINEYFQKIKKDIKVSRAKLSKSLDPFYIALDPKQDPTLEALLLSERIIDGKRIKWPEDPAKDKKPTEGNLEKKVVSYESKIPADHPWTLVCPIKEGEKISVTASGKWNRSPSTKLDANGLSSLSSNPPGKGLRESALIGKFGKDGEPFFVGESYTGVAPKDGDFYLGHNDYSLYDNSGALDVKIIRSGVTLEDKVKEEIKPKPQKKQGSKEEVEIEWSKELGGKGSYYGNHKIFIGKDGSLYISGSTFSVQDGKKCDDDPFLMKLDKNGKNIWTNQDGTAYSDSVNSVTIDKKDNIYTSESSWENYEYKSTFIVKHDSNGKKIWEKPSAIGCNLAIDNSGNICMIGKGEKGCILEKWSDNGKKMWSEQLDIGLEELLDVIATDAENNICIAGFTVGDTGGRNKGEGDILVAKYSKNGKKIWTSQFGTKKNESVRNIKIDKDGKLYLTGQTEGDLKGTNHGEADAFLTKLNENGEVLWSRQVGTKDYDVGVESIIDKENNIYFLGRTSKDKNFNNFIIKYNKDGDELWIKNFREENNYLSSGIILDGDANLYVVGQVSGCKTNLTKFKQK